MASPRQIVPVDQKPSVPAVYNPWDDDRENDDVRKAFSAFLSEARADESAVDFARRRYPGNGPITAAAQGHNWNVRRVDIQTASRDMATRQAQREIAESVRKFVPLVDDVSDMLHGRLRALRAANVSATDPEFDRIVTNAMGIGKTIAALQLSLSKQPMVQINNAQVNTPPPPTGPPKPDFSSWGQVIDGKSSPAGEG